MSVTHWLRLLLDGPDDVAVKVMLLVVLHPQLMDCENDTQALGMQ